MSMYFNELQPALHNLLKHVVRFFHPRSSCTMTHISADVQRITLNASCMTISGRRTEQLDIFCCITGFTSDFLSFLLWNLIQFFHGAIQLCISSWVTWQLNWTIRIFTQVVNFFLHSSFVGLMLSYFQHFFMICDNWSFFC